MPDAMLRQGSSQPDASRLSLMLEEVELLLGHLQRLPETRLARYFGEEAHDRQQRDSTPVPPTWDLVYFLDRLAAISCSAPRDDPAGFTVPRPPMPASPPAPAIPEQNDPSVAPPGANGLATAPVGGQVIVRKLERDRGPDLNDLAFLFWSRDFLAAITYPASVESIRVTRAFRVARMAPSGARIAAWGGRARRSFVSGRAADEGRPMPLRGDGYLGEHADALVQYGVKLARRTRTLVWLTVFFIALSVWSSFMVFSGRVLIRENDAMQALRKDLTQRIVLAEKDDRQDLGALFPRPGIVTADYCDLPATLQPGGGQAAGPEAAAQPGPLALVRNHRLCAEAKTLDEREADLKRMHQFWLMSVRPLTFVMLELPSLHIRPWRPDGEMQKKLVAMDLATHRYGMEQMVDGLIGAVLPVAYACLGALASLFRKIGLKVEAETLSPSDYGGIRTSVILGVLTGTVIGLFSDFVGAGQVHNSIPLGTTALALLAGFAADRVFVMFDEVAERIFGRSSTDLAPKPPVAAKPG